MGKAVRPYVGVSDARRQEIAELAEFIADSHCPEGCVNPEFIAKEKGITISYGHYQNAFDGLLAPCRKVPHLL